MRGNLPNNVHEVKQCIGVREECLCAYLFPLAQLSDVRSILANDVLMKSAVHSQLLIRFVVQEEIDLTLQSVTYQLHHLSLSIYYDAIIRELNVHLHSSYNQCDPILQSTTIFSSVRYTITVTLNVETY